MLPHLYEEYGDGMIREAQRHVCVRVVGQPQTPFAHRARSLRRETALLGRLRQHAALRFRAESFAGPSVSKTGSQSPGFTTVLSFDYVPAPLSIYEGINKLPAAHKLTLVDGRVEVERYWQLSYKTAEPVPSENEAAEHLRELMADAVRMRLVSDVPLGVLLSGGVDSSSVAALAVAASSEAVKTFSISFAEASFDESAYARGVAKFLGTDHHEERLSANLAANLVSEIGAWMDEPFSDPSLVPTYLLSRFTRKHVTVALGGDGGDELFAGYPMYAGLRWAEDLQTRSAVIARRSDRATRATVAGEDEEPII